MAPAKPHKPGPSTVQRVLLTGAGAFGRYEADLSSGHRPPRPPAAHTAGSAPATAERLATGGAGELGREPGYLAGSAAASAPSVGVPLS